MVHVHQLLQRVPVTLPCVTSFQVPMGRLSTDVTVGMDAHFQDSRSAYRYYFRRPVFSAYSALVAYFWLQLTQVRTFVFHADRPVHVAVATRKLQLVKSQVTGTICKIKFDSYLVLLLNTRRMMSKHWTTVHRISRRWWFNVRKAWPVW